LQNRLPLLAALCFHLNGMAWWPGNERDKVFATAKRLDQVKKQPRNNLILEQGLIGAVTLSEKNSKFDWAFATTENQHSIGDVGLIVHLFMLINAAVIGSSTLILGKQVEIFPPSRPFPLQVPTTIHRHAEQGVYSLSTFEPKKCSP
jgi:hypothetical protein